MGRVFASCRFQIPNGVWKLVEHPPWKLRKNNPFETIPMPRKTWPHPLLSAFPWALSSCQVTWASLVFFQLPHISSWASRREGGIHYPGRTGFSISFHNSISSSEDHVFSLIHFLRPVYSLVFTPTSSPGCSIIRLLNQLYQCSSSALRNKKVQCPLLALPSLRTLSFVQVPQTVS